MNTKKRRELFLEQVNDPYMAIMYSGLDYESDKRDRNFVYYTDINEKHMMLIMSKIKGIKKSALFILPFDPVEAKWIGPRMLKEEAKEISGIDDIYYVNEMNDYIRELMKDHPVVGIDPWEDPVRKNPNYGLTLWLKKEYPDVKTDSYIPYVTNQRVIKDEEEVEYLKVAQRHTLKAITAMMKHAAPEMLEAEMVGVFNLELAKQNIQEYAFPAICAGGERATTLHYGDNDHIVHDNELCLVDLGSSYHYYCADISRTFPVNGKFTKRQKEVYDVVLGAQNMVLANARPGLSVLDLNDMVIKYYEEELPKIGLLKDGKTVKDYYYHSVSHHLGLECHDVGDRHGAMAAGTVISNEPGLYIAEEGIGIRIEDDLLITEDGAICLSKDFPHTTEEIEALMAK